MARHRPAFIAPDGAIRELQPGDMPLFRDHMLRLDPASRRDRFNGVTDDEFVRAYAARCFEDGTSVVAYVEDGRVVGAAELHERIPGRRDSAEIAFSVETAFQNRGLGSVLFERLIQRAKALGYADMHVTTHPQNEAMKALARKFGAKLCFERYETVGVIDLVHFAVAPVEAPEARTGAPTSAPADDARPVNPAVALAGLARAVVDLHGAALGLGTTRQARKAR